MAYRAERFQKWRVVGCTIASLNPYDEWTRPFGVQGERLPGDLFTFWQLYPDTTPHYPYWYEWENIAIADTHSHDEWLDALSKKTRNMIRKAQKLGVRVSEVIPDMDYCLAIERIYNETPIRQGRLYKHYHEPLTNIIRGTQAFMNAPTPNIFLAAYYENSIVAVAQIITGHCFAFLNNFMGLQEHFDKAVMNALMSGVVNACTEHGVNYLAYESVSDDSLGKFKKNNGFVNKQVPRYYIPLTWRGQLLLRLHLQRGLRSLIPDRIKPTLRRAKRLALPKPRQRVFTCQMLPVAFHRNTCTNSLLSRVRMAMTHHVDRFRTWRFSMHMACCSQGIQE